MEPYDSLFKREMCDNYYIRELHFVTDFISTINFVNNMILRCNIFFVVAGILGP